MKRETLEMLTLPELRDQLFETTLLLLESIDNNADGVTIRDLKERVELLQEIINIRRGGGPA